MNTRSASKYFSASPLERRKAAATAQSARREERKHVSLSRSFLSNSAVSARLLMKLEQDIVYKGGIEFPRESADLKKYLPRLCAKHPEWFAISRASLSGMSSIK